MSDAAVPILIFDPFAGASGDMILGALLDLGIPLERFQEVAASLGLEGVEVRSEKVLRGGLSARSVQIRHPRPEPERRLADVLEILERAAVPEPVRDTARSAFEELASVEAQTHGTTPESAHFHEVGAVDALIDILGAATGVHELGVETCYTRPVALGHGWVAADHGKLPLPAPATLRLLQGVPVYETGWEGELTTPTGALLLRILTGGRRPPDRFTPIRSGYGAGSRDPETHPNCLRLILAKTAPSQSIFVLQTDIDDMSPEFLPPLTEALREAGALDVWTHPVGMKKGRTGVRVEALVASADRERVQQCLLRESTTIGLRYWPVSREELPRDIRTVEWRGYSIRVKRTITSEGHVQCKPEYDDLLDAARGLGIPPIEVWREVERVLGSGNC